MCVHIANKLDAKIDKKLRTNKLIFKKERDLKPDPYTFIFIEVKNNLLRRSFL